VSDLAIGRDFHIHRTGAVLFLQTMALERVRRGGLQVLGFQQRVDLFGTHLQAQAVGFLLHHLAELDLHAPRQADAVFLLEQEGDAALAGLAVDANHGLVAAADVGRVDRQIRHLPDALLILLGKALANRILVRAGERGMHKVADIGVARVYWQLVAFLHHLAHGVDVGEVQLRVNALGVHVQRHGDQVDVAGALAIAEQAAFDAIGAGHQAQLGGGHAGAAIVVGVQADQHAVATVDVAAEPLDLVGVDIGCGGFHRGRQVEDQLLLGGRLEHLDHGVAYLDREFRLGGAEDLRRVLETPGGFRILCGQALDDLCCVDRDVHHAGLVLVEDDAAEARRGGVVVVDDGLLGALQRLEGAGDQVFARLG